MRLELYADRAIAQLKLNLPARVAALNAVTTDFDLEAPADESYDYGLRDVMLKYPFIEVAVPDFDLRGFSIQQASAELRPVVFVACWTQYVALAGDEIDRVRLWRSLDRYQHCISQVLLQPDAFGPSVVVERLQGRTRQNPETREGEQTEVVAAVFLIFTLEDAEYNPSL